MVASIMEKDFFSSDNFRRAGFLSLILALFSCAGLTSCSDDDGDNNGGGSADDVLATLVGSEWSGEYYHVGDEGEYEEGTLTLKFTSSDRAEEHGVYQGKQWNVDGEYVSYSGENDTFYEYTVSNGQIFMNDTDGFISRTLTPVDGSTLTDGSTLYTLVKAGTGADPGEVDPGGNPATGIADFVSAPVRTFAMEFAQGSRNFKVEYMYSGNKVTRMLRSGASAGSYSLSYADDEVSAVADAQRYTFGLGATGFANYFRDGDGNAWSCRTSGDNDGYMRYFSIEDPYDYRYYLVSYSGGNVSRVEEYHGAGELYCTYDFSYTATDNKNGLYPEASIINIGLEFLRYLGFLGQPSRKLVDKIDFKPIDSSYGTMEFSYEFDARGNVTSYQYTSDPIYPTTDRRQPSPVFRFTY